MPEVDKRKTSPVKPVFEAKWELEFAEYWENISELRMVVHYSSPAFPPCLVAPGRCRLEQCVASQGASRYTHPFIPFLLLKALLKFWVKWRFPANNRVM